MFAIHPLKLANPPSRAQGAYRLVGAEIKQAVVQAASQAVSQTLVQALFGLTVLAAILLSACDDSGEQITVDDQDSKPVTQLETQVDNKVETETHAGIKTQVKTSGLAGGALTQYLEFESIYVDTRRVTIWTPEGYDQSNEPLPVLYMHDGQNLFDNATAGYGVEWGVDEHLSKLSKSGALREHIVVGIWNTPKRFREYSPSKVFDRLPANVQMAVSDSYGGAPLADEYLEFIVKELKPFVDANYRTLPDRDNTAIAGSSMGGLISLYAVSEYPDIFSKAACISIHWPLTVDETMLKSQEDYIQPISDAFVSYLEENLPPSDQVKIYFDHGTVHLDALYGPYQNQVDAVMRVHGFVDGDNWKTRKFEGHAHNEKFWRQRLGGIFTFLLAD